MSFIKRHLNTIIPIIGLIVIVVILQILSGGNTLTSYNLKNILNQVFPVMMCAAGLTLVYAHGGLDFSVGAVLAMTQLISAIIVRDTGITQLALPVSLVSGVLIYFITGIVTIKLNMPPFIASLCVKFLCTGIVSTVLTEEAINISSLPIHSWLLKLIVLAATVVALFIVLEYTKLGQYNKAIGENPVAAKQSGINVDGYKLAAYMIAGAFVGLAGYFVLCRQGAMTMNTGMGLELDVIVVLVLGGLALSGGYSAGVRAAVIGALIITLLENGLNIVGVNSYYVGLIKGFVFLAIVMTTYKKPEGRLLPR